VNKPSNFKFKLYVEYVSINTDEARFWLFENLNNQYGFTIDTECGQMFCKGYDNIYDNLKSRAIFFLRALKKENFKYNSYKIKCTIFDSTIHGELV
jgi:hypothetical protein